MEESRLVKGKKLPSVKELPDQEHRAIMTGKMAAVNVCVHTLMPPSPGLVQRVVITCITKRLKDQAY